MKCLNHILVLAAVLFCLALPAAAYTISPASETIDHYRDVYDAIYTAIDEQQSYLDVSMWAVRDYEIMSVFTDVINNSPEFFHADRKLVYRYNKNGYVTSLSFTYSMSRTFRAEAMAYYEQEISYIVRETEEVAYSAAEMALYVHDYLISAYAYDTSETVYDALGFLQTGKGVCHAYSLCYMAVLRELGIPCYMVTSTDMNHSWNLVQLEGEWYHVDLVYDDPLPDRPGQVLHDHFLLSDDAIAADRGRGAHFGWSSMFVCENDAYADAFWRVSGTRMLFLNDMWYYVDDEAGALCRSDFLGRGRKTLYTFYEKWYVNPETVTGVNDSFWKGFFTGLGFYGGYLYFNSPTTIWRFNPSNGERVELLSLDEPGLNIYGIDISRNRMEYLVGSTPDRDATAYTETIPMRYADDSEPVENVFLPFEDVSRVSPYYPAVNALYERGIMNGMSQTQFSLYSNMTRAQFAALISRIYGYDPAEYQRTVLYRDVTEDSWYAPYVNWVTETGYMTGMGNGIFAPEEPVTREQMYTILAAVGRSRKLAGGETVPLMTMDRAEIADWALDGVDFCYTGGLVPEKYLYVLSPKAFVRRGEIADVLYRFCMWEEGNL